jgi:hypothetical protein
MPHMMAARPRIWGAERVEDVRAPNMRPVGSNRQAYQKNNLCLDPKMATVI